MKQKKFYNCFSPNLLGFLMKKGFMPITQRKHKTTKKVFWVFEISAPFEKALIDYTNKRQM